jgi:hypothetical protein
MLFTPVPVAHECAGQSSPKAADAAPNGPIPVGQWSGTGGSGICHVSACELKPAPVASRKAGRGPVGWQSDLSLLSLPDVRSVGAREIPSLERSRARSSSSTSPPSLPMGNGSETRSLVVPCGGDGRDERSFAALPGLSHTRSRPLAHQAIRAARRRGQALSAYGYRACGTRARGGIRSSSETRTGMRPPRGWSRHWPRRSRREARVRSIDPARRGRRADAASRRLRAIPPARVSAMASRRAPGSRRSPAGASRASMRWPSRRKRSPRQRCVRASSNGPGSAASCSIASAKAASASARSTSIARQRADVPFAQRPPHASAAPRNAASADSASDQRPARRHAST